MLTVYEELGDSSRRQILAEIFLGPRSVSDIVRATGLKQPNVSNHLARMREREVVRSSRFGRQVIYSLATPEIERIVRAALDDSGAVTPAIRLDELTKVYAKAAISGDERGCFQVLETVFRARVDLLDFYQDLIAPAMRLVGQWYEAEAIDEAHEHLASNITERVMSRTASLTGSADRQGKVAVLGCCAGGQHSIGLRMIADFLRSHGWSAIYLGANTPTVSFVNAVHHHSPIAVFVSCATLETRPEALELIASLASIRGKDKKFVIGAGGWTVNDDPAPFTFAGADFVARDLKSFAEDQFPLLNDESFSGTGLMSAARSGY